MSDLLRVMISQPMGGKTPEEIEAVRKAAKASLEARGYHVVDTVFSAYTPPNDVVEPSLLYMGLATLAMSKVDAVYFVRGYEKARGCRIEERMAMDYGRRCLYEKECEEC